MSTAFTNEQKEYFAGLMAGIASRGLMPYVGATSTGALTADPAQGGTNLAAPPNEASVFPAGAGHADLCKQEIWKLEENGLDIWDKLMAHAEQDKFPEEADTFRFRYHGLFYVAPAQNSFMLRCRIPAGELTSL